jgi:hypothetical protein
VNSLRSELLGVAVPAGIPEFRMMLPPGWQAHNASEETERAMLAQARERLRPVHRVDLQGLLESHVSSAMRVAREQGAIMLILPGPDTEAGLFAPASIVATIREATPQLSLDDLVVDVIQRRGGQQLDDGKRLLRWVERRTTRVGTEEVGAYIVFYLTPIPGTQRARALQFALTIAHDPDIDPAEDEQIAAWTALVDAHVATFRWGR